jgi:hypothetical protein
LLEASLGLQTAYAAFLRQLASTMAATAGPAPMSLPLPLLRRSLALCDQPFAPGDASVLLQSGLFAPNSAGGTLPALARQLHASASSPPEARNGGGAGTGRGGDKRCLLAFSGENFMPMELWDCLTCGLTDASCCCKPCIDACHKVGSSCLLVLLTHCVPFRATTWCSVALAPAFATAAWV